MNQLGALAQKGVRTVMHNTLAASDYGLLDEETLEPRPDYWAAVLWSRTMGTGVLDAQLPKDSTLRVYAHCMKDTPGGVALAMLNTDQTRERALSLPVGGTQYTLSAPALTSKTTRLNGTELSAKPDGSLPALDGLPVKPGTLRLAPASITFVTLPTAANAGCK